MKVLEEVKKVAELLGECPNMPIIFAAPYLKRIIEWFKINSSSLKESQLSQKNAQLQCDQLAIEMLKTSLKNREDQLDLWEQRLVQKDAVIEKMRECLKDMVRLVEAFRYSNVLGKGQNERFEKARQCLKEVGE